MPLFHSLGQGGPLGAIGNSRAARFTRLSALHVEMIPNGTFDLDSGWSKTGNNAISGGTFNIVAQAAGQNAGSPNPAVNAVSGKKYRISFRIVSIGGGGVSLAIGPGTQLNTARTTVGIHTEIVTANNSGAFTLYTRLSTTTASIDSLSVKEVLG